MQILKFFLPALLFLEFTTACSPSPDSKNSSSSPEPTGSKSQVSRSLEYDYPSRGSGSTWLFIHGLADDRTKLQNLAELAQRDGHKVLLVDLHGHGETLRKFLKTHSELPEKLDYLDNVRDLQALVQTLEIKELVIVGHSYGGGIAYSLASKLSAEGSVRVLSVHLLAPYVQRIDQFLRDQMMSANPFWRSPVTNNHDLDKIRDSWMDPYLQRFMEKTYRDYVLEDYPKDRALTSAEKKEIDFRVEAAIRTTKGIRSFDLLDSGQELPLVQAPLQILGGERDQLVVPAQMKKFDERLKAENVPHELKWIEGPKATHLFPRLLPEETYRELLEFQKAHQVP